VTCPLDRDEVLVTPTLAARRDWNGFPPGRIRALRTARNVVCSGAVVVVQESSHRTVLVLLLGDPQSDQVDHYQHLQAECAEAEAKRAGVSAEILFAPGFDQLRILRQRLADAGAPKIDAVVTEPTSLAALDLMLKNLEGKVGLVLLNIWSPAIDEKGATWGQGHPFGWVSTNHARIGEIQGAQVNQRAPEGASVLCISGPSRASAARQRREGMTSKVRPDIHVLLTEAGDWNESDGIVAFNNWYSGFKAREEHVAVVAAQSDELAVGALHAARAVANRAHRDMFLKAKFLGVDACPTFGKKLVDDGTLSASVTTPANTDVAIRHLARFWRAGTASPLATYTEATPYP
jgi:ABC-type sugar transport system substrate-binding protein